MIAQRILPCLFLLTGALAAQGCSKEQTSSAAAPAPPRTPDQLNDGTGSPNDDIDRGSDDRMGPSAPGPDTPTEGTPAPGGGSAGPAGTK